MSLCKAHEGWQFAQGQATSYRSLDVGSTEHQQVRTCMRLMYSSRRNARARASALRFGMVGRQVFLARRARLSSARGRPAGTINFVGE